MRMRHLIASLSVAAALILAACGGGSDGGSATIASTPAPAGASSGTITAFGSVFVDGHEFDTSHALVVDDDTGSSTASTAALEVGMVVDVIPASGSSDARPVAAQIHINPLARGYVDASDASAGTLSVMGQTVQLTAATLFSDHRACVNAASGSCPAVAGQSNLTTTASAVAGSYVTVHGYLFAAGTAANSANIVATLVAVGDAPAATAAGPQFKVEGVVSAASGGSITIGALAVDLSQAACVAGGASVACSGAYSAGQIVSAYAAAAPALPAANFSATAARARPKLVAQTAGAAVELEGRVSSVTLSPAGFVLGGVAVDATALPSGSALPAVGDIVRVAGTVGASGSSIVASAVTVLRAAISATYGFEGDAGSVAPGASANTYTLSLLGQTITVNANTRLADESLPGRRGMANPGSNPFNIATFQTYLAASASKHVQVRAQADALGNLSAIGLAIVPASTTASLSGVVDATPPPVNGSAGVTPTSFDIHGIVVSADASAILPARIGAGMAISAGDLVLVHGSYAGGMISVAAPASGTRLGPFATNVVIDMGVPTRGDRDCF